MRLREAARVGAQAARVRQRGNRCSSCPYRRPRTIPIRTRQIESPRMHRRGL